MTGTTIKTVLEDVCDNLLNSDPTTSRVMIWCVDGLSYSCSPLEIMGKHIGDMRIGCKLIDVDKKYQVAGWAPVAEEARTTGNPMVWEVVETWLKARGGKVSARKLNAPRIIGALPYPGYAAV